MSPRRKSKRTGSRSFVFFLRILFWVVLAGETIWLLAFVWATGSLLPPGLGKGKASLPAALGVGLSGEKQQEMDDLMVRQMLEAEGSKGRSGIAPETP